MPEPNSTPVRGAAVRPHWLALVVVLAVLLRAWEATESSLWLDELHTLYHASQPSLRAVLESVRRDVHTPLYFLAVHLLGGWSQGPWLRVVPIVSTLLLFLPVVRLARCAGLTPGGVLLAAFLLAVLPYQVLYGAELRPYAWLGIFGAFAFQAAFSEAGSVRGRLSLFFVSVLLGLLTHPLMGIAVLGIGAARLVVPRDGRVPLLGLVGTGALAGSVLLPWFLMFAQKATASRAVHDAALGDRIIRDVLLREMYSLPARLGVPFVGELGGVWTTIETLGGIALLCAALLALAAWIVGLRREGCPQLLRGMAAYLVATFALTTAFAAYSWDRVPLQYYTSAAWTLPVLIAWLLDAPRAPGVRRAVFALAVPGGLMLAVGLCGGISREDMRAAAAAVRVQGAASANPIYTSMLSQPPIFPHDLPYRAYARELEPVEPQDIPAPGEPGFERPVIVLRRAVPLWHKAWREFVAGRKIVHEERIDRYLSVYTLEPDADAP